MLQYFALFLLVANSVLLIYIISVQQSTDIVLKTCTGIQTALLAISEYLPQSQCCANGIIDFFIKKCERRQPPKQIPNIVVVTGEDI